jgi:hypothetical protein
MKKLLSIILLLTIIVALNSCFRGRHTIIAYRNNNNEVKVEYAGTLAFDPGYTHITSISHGGYLKYNNNDRKIYAENGSGDQIVYKLNNGDKTTELNEEGKLLLKEAIKMIAKQQSKIN